MVRIIIARCGQMCAQILSALLILIRPILGPARCRYEQGCTSYALQQLREKPLISALISITKRLLSCNPF